MCKNIKNMAIKQIYLAYTTKEQYNDLKGQLNAMQIKIDKIYDVIMSGGVK